MKRTKRQSRKQTLQKVAEHKEWTVLRGKLVPSRARPDKVTSLFRVVAEKIPYECLAAIEKDMERENLPATGIYLAHDSMGWARYAGRDNVFTRLRARWETNRLELCYFSFYVILDKKHEREIETLVIRASGPILAFNERKKRPTIETGNIRDYEPGTLFYERQKKRGKKRS